jgi:hypothetical protein
MCLYINIFGLYNNIHWGRCHGGQFVHSAHLGNNDGGFAKHDAMGGIKGLAIGQAGPAAALVHVLFFVVSHEGVMLGHHGDKLPVWNIA